MMLGTKVVIRLKENPKARKVIFFLGKPQQYHLYLLLKEDTEFCPCPMDNDSDYIKSEYDNVIIETIPIEIQSTMQRKMDYAKDFLKKVADEIIPQTEGSLSNKFIWHNIVAHKANELIVAIGGYYLSKEKKYILFEEEKPLYNEDGVYVG